MHLNLFLAPAGYSNGGWRMPGSQSERIHDFTFTIELVRQAERAKLDAVFLADLLTLGDNPGRQPTICELEPLTSIAALAASTEKIGLVATASTSFTEPFNLARYFATIDHISKGRAGWNIVTSFTGGENFTDGLLDHEQRYRRAAEHVEIVTQLWNSWQDDAIVNDAAGGYWARPERIHKLDHSGEYFKVAGPLNVARSPQGWPVLVQAGTSATGMDFAARWAEVIFTVQPDLTAARTFYSGLKDKVESHGRDGAKVAVLPGILPIIGDTEAQAKELADELANLINFDAGRGMLNTFLQTKLDDLELDQPIPRERLPLPEEMQGQRSRYELFYKLATEENYTLRELIKVRAVAAGHLLAVGTAEQVADTMESWFAQGASDGFNLEVPYLTDGLTKITEQLVPELRARGLFREDYTGSTLRDHLGLDRPAGQE